MCATHTTTAGLPMNKILSKLGWVKGFGRGMVILHSPRSPPKLPYPSPIYPKSCPLPGLDRNCQQTNGNSLATLSFLLIIIIVFIDIIIVIRGLLLALHFLLLLMLKAYF